MRGYYWGLYAGVPFFVNPHMLVLGLQLPRVTFLLSKRVMYLNYWRTREGVEHLPQLQRNCWGEGTWRGQLVSRLGALLNHEVPLGSRILTYINIHVSIERQKIRTTG